MSKITLQQIFNATWQAFVIEDNPPGINNFGDCAYLTGAGYKCPIGLCLPDGHKAQKSRDKFGVLVQQFPELFDESVINKGVILLNRFQRQLHDGILVDNKFWPPKEKLTALYKQVAEDFNLTIPK